MRKTVVIPGSDFVRPFALTAVEIESMSRSTSAASRPTEVASSRKRSAKNSSATPSPTGSREWGGFSAYEIEYGIRAAGGP